MAAQTTDLAILFADISGSTRLYEVLGDVAARKKITECLDLLTAVVARHDGTVIKTIGDEIMCTFPSAEAAANAACDMQESVAEEITEQTVSGPVSLAIRIGMHFGPAILESGDVFGDAVNVAARMASIAKSNQIITTQSTVEGLPAILRASTRFIDRAPVKGKKDTMEIFEVLWQQEDVTRMSTGVVEQPLGEPVHLQLRYRDQVVVLDEHTPHLVLGRSKAADITVKESLASRQHVKIEQRRGKFFIIDQSTNGTYVINDAQKSFLRREEMPLGTSGKISLGRSFSEDPQEIVHFSADF